MTTQNIIQWPKVGIVGGLGPKTGFTFAENINNAFSKITRIQPDLLMINLPVPEAIMKRLAHGEKTEEIKRLLLESVRRLNCANVDFIVIPCNTVHIFIKEMRLASKKPILSIVEETVEECQKRQVKAIGILASTATIKQKLYETEFHKIGINTIVPNLKNQNQVTGIIIKIINNNANNNDKQKLITIIKRLSKQGADIIMLACTDLQLLISQKDSLVPLLDTNKILEAATLDKLLIKK